MTWFMGPTMGMIRKVVAYGLCLYLLSICTVPFANKSLNRHYHDKLFVHRVNSVEKLFEVSSVYRGVELDLVFNSVTGVFDVNHPPAPSIGLTLKTYLESRDHLFGEIKYWLDIKNLDGENASQILRRINFLISEFGIKKNQMILESDQYESLKLFIDDDFIVSYYITKRISDHGDLELSRADSAINIINSHYLSSDRRNMDIVKRHFPDVKMLTWSIERLDHLELNPIELVKNVRKTFVKYFLLSDGNIEVVLITVPSSGHR